MLTKHEHERLMECLRAIRAKGKLNEVLRNLFVLQSEDGDTTRLAPEIIDWLASQYLEDSKNYGDEVGLLIRCFGGARSHSDTAMWHLTETEFVLLKQTVQAMRSGGWFRGWLQLQLTLMANGTTPAERFPSPEQVMGTLARELGRVLLFLRYRSHLR